MQLDINNINEYIKKYQNMGIDEKYTIPFLNTILSKERSINNLYKVGSLKEMLYVTNFDNLDVDEESKQNREFLIRPVMFNQISYDMLTKTNIKHYNQIKNLLLSLGLDNCYSSDLAFKIYATLGYNRSIDLLTNKYGNISIDKIIHLFSNIDCSSVMYKQVDNKYVPIINDILINLLFSDNYKVENTVIKNYLSEFLDMEEYIDEKIEKINTNDKLTEEQKQEKINNLELDLEHYCNEVRTFITNFPKIFSQFDIIEEEFIKKQSVTSLKLKLNIPEINEILSNLSQIRKKIQKKQGLNRIKNRRLERIPNYELRDYPLLNSDLFDYVGIDNQFVLDPTTVNNRALELSRMMEEDRVKKFPKLTIEKDNLTIRVFHPKDRNLISAGFKTASCFRPNGYADNGGANNSLIRYCIVNEYAGGLEITNKYGNTLMFSPILRNGNVLMLHSFESMGLSTNELKKAHELLKIWANKVLEISRKEEDEESLIMVMMTTASKEFDIRYSCGRVNKDKKFNYYDPNYEYREMYTNLKETDHYILALLEDKKVEDIKYNYEVSKSYSFAPIEEVNEINITDEVVVVISKINQNNKTLLELAEKRRNLIINKKEIEAFETLKNIKNIKQENIRLQRILSKKRSINIFEQYLDSIDKVNEINAIKKINTNIDYIKVRMIVYAEGFYILIFEDGNIKGEYLDGFYDIYTNKLNDYIKSGGYSR